MRGWQRTLLLLVVTLVLTACGNGGGAATRDGTWQGPTLNEADESGGATNVRMAVGDGGHAVVSWNTFHAGGADMFLAVYDPVTGWDGEVSPSRDIESVTYPSMDLAVDPLGNTLGVWGERQRALPGEPTTLYATVYDAATGTWTGREALESDDTGKAYRGEVAMGPGGSFWVLFALHLGTTMEIYLNRFVPAAGWGGPELLDSSPWDPDDSSPGRLQLDVDASGNAVACWSRYLDTDGSGIIDRVSDRKSVFARRYDGATTTWGPLQRLNPTAMYSAYVSDVQVDPMGGGFLVVWYQYDVDYMYQVYGQFYRGGVLLSPTVLWTHAEDYWPSGAAVDKYGNAFVFGQSDNLTAVCRYDAGSGWQPSVLLQDDPLADAYIDDFAVSAGGDAFVIWREDFGGGDVDVFARRFDMGAGTWGAVQNLEGPDTGRVASGARVVADPSGNAMVAWHADDGPSQSYWSARYFQTTGWSAPMEIDNGPLETVQYGTCVAADPSGVVHAAWAQGAADDEDVYVNVWK